MLRPELHPVLVELAALRTELVDRAFVLECRGRLDAADEAMTISARIAELLEEFEVVRQKTGHDAA